MHSSALSMPPSGSLPREKSDRNRFARSRSQPPVDNLGSFLSIPNMPSNTPMKSFIENLLHLTPHRHLSMSNALTTRTKVGSSLGTNLLTDRSSRIKLPNPSSSIDAPTSSDTRPPSTQLTRKFRRASKLILFSIYWCNFARKKNLSRSSAYQSYLQTTAPTEKYMFDKSNFKTQTFEILPEIQAFFKQPTGARDLDNADEIRKSLIDIKPFTRLPRLLQDRLLQRGWYECHQERRTIVRQDERPANFYIILSGSAIPTYKRATDGTIETLDVLKRGSTFGEKGVMTNSTQSFTITSKTKLELLVLWKDDFKSIFMTNERHCSKDDLRFLKNNVPFLYGFPIERLNESNDAIQHCNFRQQEVIARDSRRMKHIYVVRKGSLAIWKRLDPHGNQPVTMRNRPFSAEKENATDDEDEATGDDRTLFSEMQLIGDTDTSLSNSTKLDADFRLSRLRRSNIADQRISSAASAASQETTKEEKPFPGLIDKRDRLQTIDYDALIASRSKAKPPATVVTRKPSHVPARTISKSQLIYPENMLYVHVKTVTEGQHFGLTDMIFPNQPVLTLISNGCECLLLHKASFIEIASDQYKQNLRRSEIPFPTDVAFYREYHDSEIWKRFTRKTYIDAFQRVHLESFQDKRRSPMKADQNHRRSIMISPV